MAERGVVAPVLGHQDVEAPAFLFVDAEGLVGSTTERPVRHGGGPGDMEEM